MKKLFSWLLVLLLIFSCRTLLKFSRYLKYQPEPHVVVTPTRILPTASYATYDVSPILTSVAERQTELLTAMPTYHSSLATSISLLKESTTQSFATPTTIPIRLMNGVFRTGLPLDGAGKLVVVNDSDYDVVVAVWRTDATFAFAAYVGSLTQTKITGIRDGTYRFYITMGEDWDHLAKAFTRKAAYFVPKEDFTFTTTSETYTEWNIQVDDNFGQYENVYIIGKSSFPKIP